MLKALEGLKQGINKTRCIFETQNAPAMSYDPLQLCTDKRYLQMKDEPYALRNVEEIRKC